MSKAAQSIVLLLLISIAACAKHASIDSPGARQMLAAPATGNPAPLSHCDSTQECERECAGGMANACTRLGDEHVVEDIEKATTLWLGACRDRDGEACARLVRMAAHDPDLSLLYARRACAYEAAEACFLLGKMLMFRAGKRGIA